MYNKNKDSQFECNYSKIEMHKEILIYCAFKKSKKSDIGLSGEKCIFQI